MDSPPTLYCPVHTKVSTWRCVGSQVVYGGKHPVVPTLPAVDVWRHDHCSRWVYLVAKNGVSA